MSNIPPIRTQILVFTLFGDYVLPLKEDAWTKGLLHLLGQLGVSERAGRSTLSRMKKKGWLTSERMGRYSRYSLTRRGLRVVREAETRIFARPRVEWDGQWHMVVYSIPEKKRDVRSNLRQRLSWLGFGRLAPGTWISPNNPHSDIDQIFVEIGAKPYALHFSGMTPCSTSDQEIVDRCWDLDSLNEEYARFLDKYRPDFDEFTQALSEDRALDHAECFKIRFWLTLEYSQFPRRDPNLPPVLLRSDWLGGEAAELFTSFHKLLKDPSNEYVSAVLSTSPRKE